jgi:hypothetical protein
MSRYALLWFRPEVEREPLRIELNGGGMLDVGPINPDEVLGLEVLGESETVRTFVLSPDRPGRSASRRGVMKKFVLNSDFPEETSVMLTVPDDPPAEPPGTATGTARRAKKGRA